MNDRPSRSTFITLVGFELVACAVLLLVNGLVPLNRYKYQPEYRQRVLDETVQQVRTEAIKRRRAELEQMPNRWPGSLENLERDTVIDRSKVEKALQDQMQKTLNTSLILIPLLVIIGIGIILRWRWARIAGIIAGVLFGLVATLRMLPGLENPTEHSHVFWGPIAIGFFLAITLLLALIGRRRKAEFTAGAA